jgi:hypothetical protein
MRGSRLAATAAAFCVAAILGAQAAPAPTALPKPPPKTARARLDFSGVWEIDPKESKGVSKNQEKAVISIHQTGDRILMEPIEQRRPWLTAEEIIVDGQWWEKTLGGGRKGRVQAEWSKDGKELWIQTATGTEENPNASLQRTVWKLQDGGKTWTRQTWTVQKDDTRVSLLVFRKRLPAKKP